ncbi:hypothetical protein D3C80_2160930 [compost metagenome]
MRSFFKWLQICQGTSNSTITSRDATMKTQHSATSDSALISAADGATCIKPIISSW